MLFEWSSLEHVSPNGKRLHPLSISINGRLTVMIEAILPINPGQAGSGYNSSDAWDYFHINSVDKDSEGDYLISARDACAVHKIDGSTGEIIWRLGGTKSDFELGPEVEFCFQHHARFVSKDGDEEIISLYDNSAHGTEDGRGHEVHTYPYSRGKIIKVNTATSKASIVQAFHPPDNLLSKSQGSTQLLPNGNVVVNWGSEGALTEFRADGTPIFHAYMDSGYLGLGVENYRGFRYNWTGIPHEEPSIVSLKNNHGTNVYVSWNGDTETDLWRFYTVTDEYGSREFLGESKRDGFETSLSIKGRSIDAVSAEAISSRGQVLTSTGIAKIQNEVLPPSASKLEDDSDGYLPVAAAKVLEEGKSMWADYMILKVDRLRVQ